MHQEDRDTLKTSLAVDRIARSMTKFHTDPTEQNPFVYRTSASTADPYIFKLSYDLSDPGQGRLDFLDDILPACSIPSISEVRAKIANSTSRSLDYPRSDRYWLEASELGRFLKQGGGEELVESLGSDVGKKKIRELQKELQELIENSSGSVGSELSVSLPDGSLAVTWHGRMSGGPRRRLVVTLNRKPFVSLSKGEKTTRRTEQSEDVEMGTDIGSGVEQSEQSERGGKSENKRRARRLRRLQRRAPFMSRSKGEETTMSATTSADETGETTVGFDDRQSGQGEQVEQKTVSDPKRARRLRRQQRRHAKAISNGVNTSAIRSAGICTARTLVERASDFFED